MRHSQGVGACEEIDATSYLYRFILQVHLAASCGLAKHGREPQVCKTTLLLSVRRSLPLVMLIRDLALYSSPYSHPT